MKHNDAPILLVEDDANDVVLVQRALRRGQIDIETRVVTHVAQARAYLAGEQQYADRVANPLPLLVLLDLKMPGGNGVELLRWLRLQPGLKRLPVIVLSSSREPVDVDAAYDAGCNSYLVKPVSFDALQTMLTTLGRYWLNFNAVARLSPPGSMRRSSGA
jgi:CheY-like chemotaxis protein